MHLGVANLVADGVGGIVHLHAQAGRTQALLYLHGVLDVLVADGQHTGLLGSQPHREGTGVGLNQVGQRPLIAAQRGAVDDIGQLLLAVLVGIVHAKALGQQHVDLNRDQRVLLAVDVFVLDVQLGAVKGGLVDAHSVLHAQVVQNLRHGCLRNLPLLGRPLVFVVRVGRVPLREAEGALFQKPHRAKAVFGQLQAALELLLQLVGPQDIVPLGNGELPHADQAVHLAAVLVAEERGGLGQAHGKLAVGAVAAEVNLILEGAGHGAQRKAFLGFVVRVAQHEHTVEIMIPVARNLVQLALGQQRGFGQLAAPLLLLVLYPSLKQLHHARALGHQDRQPLTDAVHRGKVAQLPPQLVVVALERLLLLDQVGVQLLLGREGHAVNALQHLVLLVALPVRPGALRQAEGLDRPGAEQVRPGAQVGELALPVKADGLALRQLLNQLHLVGLLPLGHQAHGLGPGELKALNPEIFLDNLLHLGLQRPQHLGGKGNLRIDVVIKAVLNGRTDRELGLRIEPLDGLCQNV